MAELEGMIRVDECAKYLGIHEMTVYRLAKKGRLPMFKVGGCWRTKKSLLDQFLLKDTFSGVPKV